MNIILIRQQERLRKIAQIQASLKKAKNPDIKKLLMMCCSDWGMSERTIKDYIKIAQFNLSKCQ